MSPPPSSKSADTLSYDATMAQTLRWQLLTLVLVLTFEGIARKLQLPGMNVPLFLLKDAVTVVIGLHVLRMKRPRAIDFLFVGYLVALVLFLPNILQTALYDPLLALFGAKEYLLYPVVGFAVFYAFYDLDALQIAKFYRLFSLLIIPAVVIGLIQLRLPPTHWLNLSVEGDNLGGFSAGGKLRVSGTFSFEAQFGAFLDAQMCFLAVALGQAHRMNFLWKMVLYGMVPLLIVGCYMTGSRGAVLGATFIFGIAFGLSLLKFQPVTALRMVGIALALVTLIMVGQYFFPDEFAAYSNRERGQLIGVSGEIQNRIMYQAFTWVSQVFSTPLFGYGLGIMSNGSDTFSNYAAIYRDTGNWTETDFATTLFEGGAYLLLVWYGFRFFIIYQTTSRFLIDVREEFFLPAAVMQGFVILFGFTGTLGYQPPLAIWWWMAIGTSLVLWWKCVEPKRDQETGETIPLPPPDTRKKIRGRSAYADKLHGSK